MSILSRLRARLRGSQDERPGRLPSPDDLVLLARPAGEPEALMMQEMLAAEGIVAMVRNRDAATARGGGWGPSWAYDLLVRRADLRRARGLLHLPDEDR
jgi:hypothetical protein